MKVLVVVVALLAVCASASTVPKDILGKLVPKFTTGYVIKGEDAVAHEAPFILSLSSNSKKHSHICGATLINKEWCLTAAHCISKPEGMGVVAGLHERLNVTTDTTQNRTVDFGKIHPGYTGGVGPYDIAILHVSQPFVFNEFVQPAFLPSPEHIYSGDTSLYGWGQPKAYILTGSKVLKTMEVPILDWDECKETLPDNAPLDITNICTSSKSEGKSACNGDSGGPLVMKRANGTFVELVGIVSWGYLPCGYLNMPSIYTRVSHYIDWVSQIQAFYYSFY